MTGPLGVTLSLSNDAIVVTVAQVVLAVLVVAASIFLTRLLHDAVPSAFRSGVASGVGAFSWIAFVPFALIFGVLTAGWMITAATVLAGALLMRLGLRRGAESRDQSIGATESAVVSVTGPVER